MLGAVADAFQIYSGTEKNAIFLTIGRINFLKTLHLAVIL